MISPPTYDAVLTLEEALKWESSSVILPTIDKHKAI